MSLSVKQLANKEYVDNIDFDIFNMQTDILMDSAVTIVGKRRSGKSELIRNIAYELRNKVKDVYLFSGTADTQMDFWNFVPIENVYKGLNEEKLDDIFESQKEMIQQAEADGNKDKSTLPYVMIIFDDVIKGAQGVRHSDKLAFMYCNGRHFNVLSMLCVQGYKSCSPQVRENTDVSIAFRFKNQNTSEDFVKENFNCSSDIGRRIMTKICEDDENPHQCIVVLAHLRTGNIEKQIKKYTAQIITDQFVINNKSVMKVVQEYKTPLFKKEKAKKPRALKSAYDVPSFDPDEE